MLLCKIFLFKKGRNVVEWDYVSLYYILVLLIDEITTSELLIFSESTNGLLFVESENEIICFWLNAVTLGFLFNTRCLRFAKY